jgi:thymidylate synthase
MTGGTRHGTACSINLGTFERFADAWLTCLREVLECGQDIRDDGLILRELLNVTMSARSCGRQDLLDAGAAEDRLQLMITKYESLSILPQYDLSYGSLFRRHGGVNQIDWLVRRLERKPDTKSATIGFHVPGNEALSCVSLVDCKVRDGELHLNAVYRSQNVFASQPGNACALERLQREIAEKVGVSQGVLTLHVMSAHVYELNFDLAWSVARRSPHGGDVCDDNERRPMR